MRYDDDYDICPVCNEACKHSEMARTFDCHGIPYRLVCYECYDKIMNEIGYDGSEYDYCDERFDYDY